MGFSIRVAESRKYIVCRVLGPFTVDYARTFTIELDRISRAEKIKRFLTDVRNAANISSTTENYRFAYEDMPRLDLQRDVVRNERRQTSENTPYGIAETRLPEMVYADDHP